MASLASTIRRWRRSLETRILWILVAALVQRALRRMQARAVAAPVPRAREPQAPRAREPQAPRAREPQAPRAQELQVLAGLWAATARRSSRRTWMWCARACSAQAVKPL